MGSFDFHYDKMNNRVDEAILADGQKKSRICYSAYEEYKDDNLDKIAAKGKVILVGYADEFWGGKKSKDYRSPVLENPTWLQVAVHANRMISSTRDTHHCFLESLEYKGSERIGGEEVHIYEFSMGS